MTPTDTAAYAQLAVHFAASPPPRLGVAVSGGSDSLALLYLLQDWRRAGGPDLAAVTVDHGLRAESAAEATAVAQICTRLDIPHDILHWQDKDGAGNLPDRARRARYALMADWAQSQALTDIAIGHTQDDLAETFLMRLARGAGVDGLAAMRPRWTQGTVTFHRPLLNVARETLRDHLRGLGQSWVEDPTNADTAYLRPRARQVLAALAPLGLEAATLCDVARNLADARSALQHSTHAAAHVLTRVEAGDLLVDHPGFADLPDDIARRLLSAALHWLTGADYPSRGSAMSALLAAARKGQSMTLQGCFLLPGKTATFRLTREYDAVKDLHRPAPGLWDDRWQATGPGLSSDIHIAALGPAGLRACPDWRISGLPRASALATPGLWHGETLIAAPLMGWPNGWTLTLHRDRNKLLSALLSH